MSNPPDVVTGARWGSRGGPAGLADALEQCIFAGSAMWGDPWNMIDVAEHHAAVDGILRTAMDENAARSHQ